MSETQTGATSSAVDALRDLPPNATITVTERGRRFGVTVNARTIVKDYDDAVADRDYYRAEAEKWERIALRLSDEAVYGAAS